MYGLRWRRIFIDVRIRIFLRRAASKDGSDGYRVFTFWRLSLPSTCYYQCRRRRYSIFSCFLSRLFFGYFLKLNASLSDEINRKFSLVKYKYNQFCVLLVELSYVHSTRSEIRKCLICVFFFFLWCVCLSQMLDMIQPRIPGKISLSDLKRCKMTPIFFDTFFNLEKYLDHEQRDPFASQRDHDNDVSSNEWIFIYSFQLYLRSLLVDLGIPISLKLAFLFIHLWAKKVGGDNVLSYRSITNSWIIIPKNSITIHKMV